MENTGKMLFAGETAPSWFVSLGEQSLGPMTAADLHEKIQKGELTWAHFIWKQGMPAWSRACDVETFAAAVPRAPSASSLDSVKALSSAPRKGPPAAPTAPEAPAEERSWYLHHEGSQYGPFSQEEIRRFLLIGRIDGKAYVWQDGMANWDRVEKVPAFNDVRKAAPSVPPPPSPPAAPAKAKEQRTAPRRPLVARILMSGDKTTGVAAAMCRDISVGGMQVLTDQAPGVIGTRIRLNVSPPVGQGSALKPFVAEGVVVRVLEDGRGFSFRFEKLSDEARLAIEEYIKSSD